MKKRPPPRCRKRLNAALSSSRRAKPGAARTKNIDIFKKLVRYFIQMAMIDVETHGAGNMGEAGVFTIDRDFIAIGRVGVDEDEGRIGACRWLLFGDGT